MSGDSDGADQRRGMDALERSGTQNGGSVSPAVGAVVGFGIGAVVELTKQKQTPTDDVDDGEDQGMGMTM